MSILSVPLTDLPVTTPSALQPLRPLRPAAWPGGELTATGLTENDRMALHLAPPWHAEILTHARTGEVLLTPCDCMLERDHDYAERMAWPAGLMRRGA